jgi:uncharacterized protein (DUF433 family)
MRDDTALAEGIVMNPHISSGTPCIVGHRISTEILAGRFCAGDSIASLVDDLNIEQKAVENALRYEFMLRKKRIKRPRAVRGMIP